MTAAVPVIVSAFQGKRKRKRKEEGVASRSSHQKSSTAPPAYVSMGRTVSSFLAANTAKLIKSGVLLVRKKRKKGY